MVSLRRCLAVLLIFVMAGCMDRPLRNAYIIESNHIVDEMSKKSHEYGAELGVAMPARRAEILRSYAADLKDASDKQVQLKTPTSFDALSKLWSDYYARKSEFYTQAADALSRNDQAGFEKALDDNTLYALDQGKKIMKELERLGEDTSEIKKELQEAKRQGTGPG